MYKRTKCGEPDMQVEEIADLLFEDQRDKDKYQISSHEVSVQVLEPPSGSRAFLAAKLNVSEQTNIKHAI